MFKRGAMTRFWIATINHHDQIMAGIGTYTFMVVALILFVTIGGVISLTIGLAAIGLGGLVNVCFLTFIANTRRAALRDITDPELRQLAYEAMVVFLEKRKGKMSRKDYFKLYGVQKPEV